jgi:hypothetical protein
MWGVRKMIPVIDKHPNLTIDLDTQSKKPEWFEDMTQEEQKATDEILDYLNQSSAKPHTNIKGDIIEIITAIVNSLKDVVTDHLSPSLKILTDYIARWLCRYFEQTNASTIQIAFGFNAQIPEGRDA